MMEPNVELQMLKYHELCLSVKALWLSRVTLGLLGLDCASPYLDIYWLSLVQLTSVPHAL